MGFSKLSRGLHCDTLPGEKAPCGGEGTLLERGGSLQHLTHPRHFTSWLFLYEAAAPPAVSFEVCAGRTANLKIHHAKENRFLPNVGSRLCARIILIFGVLGPLIFVKG